MQMKQLNDFPEFVQVRATIDRLRAEEQKIIARQEEIHAELNKPKQQINGQDAWAFALENEGEPSFNSDAKSSLQEEYQLNEGRLRFIAEALATGTMELDKVHGRVSLEICNAHRGEFVDVIHKLLQAIKTICECNRTLESMRNDLEARGIRTGSIASATFEIGGDWNSVYGGRVVSYQKYIAEFYPELAGTAGPQGGVKDKLRKLAEKVQSLGGEV
jgi:hypothetical protein